MSISINMESIYKTIPKKVSLVAVSKTQPNSAIKEAYDKGQRIFGENKVQELTLKFKALPKDIEWHLIGHLQKNKVKYIVPFVSLIHSIDSFDILKAVNNQAKKYDKVVKCLLQAKIAQEESKFGLTFDEIRQILNSEKTKELTNISIVGLMGIASFTKNKNQIKDEFDSLKSFFDTTGLKILSMGMSEDYLLAIQRGSNMVRIGSVIFGKRI